ncbi:SusC/RagA family TonB-linked outer membrane protein, partial [Alistipes shahii]
MTKKIFLSLMAVLGLLLSAHAQEREITGSVKDHAGAGIVGATILVEGTTKGTTSGADGSFSIKAAPDNVLVVSFMGYQSHTIKVGTQTRIDVVLKENTQAIDDVIVVAFGTAKKEAFTGSATVIKSDDIAKSQQSNVAQALAGKVAGVQLTNTSGQPGESPKIRIRGFSSLNAGNDPLWIVDGMPYSGDLNNLNPSDIESMTVLKDAASNSLYGARGANGVVMITTKKAKSQEAHVTIDAKWGVNSRAVQDYAYITNPAQFYELHYSALKNYYVNSGMSIGEAHLRANTNLTANANDGGLGYMVYTVPSGQEFIGINGKVNPAATLGRRLVYEGKEYYIRPDDWTDAAFRSSLRQEYNASISGQTGNASIYGSFGYLNNEGIAYNSDMDRYTARLRVDYQAKKWLKFGANANYTHFRYNQIDDSGAGNSSGNVFAYTTAVGPIYPLYIRDGEGNVMYNEDGIKLYDYGNGDNAGMERSLFPNSNALSDSRLN